MRRRTRRGGKCGVTLGSSCAALGSAARNRRRRPDDRNIIRTPPRITSDPLDSLTMWRMKRAVVLSFVTVLALHVMAFERQPNADYHARREHLASKLEDGV